MLVGALFLQKQFTQNLSEFPEQPDNAFKNLPYPRVLWIMVARDFLDAISAWKGLLSGNGSYFIAIVKSKLGFVKWWLFHRRKSNFPVSRKGKTGRLFRWQYCMAVFCQRSEDLCQNCA